MSYRLTLANVPFKKIVELSGGKPFLLHTLGMKFDEIHGGKSFDKELLLSGSTVISIIWVTNISHYVLLVIL